MNSLPYYSFVGTFNDTLMVDGEFNTINSVTPSCGIVIDGKHSYCGNLTYYGEIRNGNMDGYGSLRLNNETVVGGNFNADKWKKKTAKWSNQS